MEPVFGKVLASVKYLLGKELLSRPDEKVLEVLQTTLNGKNKPAMLNSRIYESETKSLGKYMRMLTKEIIRS